jgi:hypothetical protein
VQHADTDWATTVADPLAIANIDTLTDRDARRSDVFAHANGDAGCPDAFAHANGDAGWPDAVTLAESIGHGNADGDRRNKRDADPDRHARFFGDTDTDVRANGFAGWFRHANANGLLSNYGRCEL